MRFIITGVLILLASLGTAREKARDAKRISDLVQIRVAVEKHLNDYGSFPSAITSDEIGRYLFWRYRAC